MSAPPPRIVRAAPDASGEIEVMQFGAEGGDGSDDEAMFEFDDEDEAAVYESAQKKLAAELGAKNANAAAGSASSSAAASASAAPSPAAAAAPGVGGMATVVQINIVPSFAPAAPEAAAASGSAASAGAEPAAVSVGMSVIERFVPHLNAHKAESEQQTAAVMSLPQSGNITSADLVATAPMAAASAPASSAARNDADDSDDESAAADADASGADLVLTGDLDVDQNTLAALMAGKDAAMSSAEDPSAARAAGAEDSSSEDEDDEEDLALKREAANLDDIGSDEEADVASGAARGVYTKNEVKPSELAAPAEFLVPESELLRPVGRIRSVVDRVMVVMSSRPGVGLARAPALDIGSAICLANRHPVGRVEEVFGLVSEPFYSVRLLASMDPALLPQPAPIADDSDDEEEKSGGTDEQPSDLVYSIAGLSSFASADKRPGTDASNMHDEEVAEDEQEFSDDEKELEAKAAKRAASRKTQQEKRAKEGAAATADGAAPGALPTGRAYIKAKRANNRESGGEGGAANRPSPSKPAASSNPAAPQPIVPQQPVAPAAAASKHAPLLPMPGTQQPMQQQHLMQPFNPYAHAYYPPQGPPPQHGAYSMYAAQPPQGFGYPQQQAPNPYAAYYAQQGPPQQPFAYGQAYPQQPPQQQQQAAPGAVAGGFAGWGAQNLAGAPAGGYYSPYTAYPQNPYMQQQQPMQPQQQQQQSDAPPPAAP